jgi:hypothetical protein
MGLFSDSGVNKAKVSGGKGMPLAEGEYILEITDVRAGKTKKKEAFFEVLHRVVESNNPNQPIGSMANLFCLFGGEYPDLGAGQALEIATCASGLDPRGAADAKAIASENWEKVLEDAVAKPALFVGRQVRCVVTAGKNKKGGVSLYRTYSPVKETK